MQILVHRPSLLLGLAFAIAQWWHIVALWDVAYRSHWGIIWFMLMSAGTFFFLNRSLHYRSTEEERVEVLWMDRATDAKDQ